MPSLRVLRGPGTTKVFRLVDVETQSGHIATIGRDERTCDICLAPRTISRQHARISKQGDAYMLEDQEITKRQTKPQTGSCLHCHASIMPLYRELGDGDAMAGFEKTYQMSYKELNTMLHDSGHAHPVS